MRFISIPLPKALKQAFLCTWASDVVMPQEKEPVSDWCGMWNERTLEAKQKPWNPQATGPPLLWWSRRRWKVENPPSQHLLMDLRVTGAGGHTLSAPDPKANHAGAQLSGLGLCGKHLPPRRGSPAQRAHETFPRSHSRLASSSCKGPVSFEAAGQKPLVLARLLVIYSSNFPEKDLLE